MKELLRIVVRKFFSVRELELLQDPFDYRSSFQRIDLWQNSRFFLYKNVQFFCSDTIKSAKYSIDRLDESDSCQKTPYLVQIIAYLSAMFKEFFSG